MSTRIKTVAATSLVIAALVSGVAQADMESAREALSRNDFSTAITQLDEVLSQSPDNAEAQFLKGLALARSGDTDQALTVFNALVENDPDMAEAWNNLGVLRARANDLEGAQQALEEAVRINPEHGPAQENLGDIYVAMAQGAYARAGELETDNAIARAKSQQLAEFIGGGSAAGARSGANAGSGSSTPPAVPGVTRRAAAEVDIDTSTPQATLESWARAWSAQNVRQYLAMYAPGFQPDDGASRAAWAAERRDRVNSPSRIDIGLSDTQIERRGEQALVRFTQRYQSNTYQDREQKALLLTETENGWRILREGLAQAVAFTTSAAETESVDSRVVPPSSNDTAAAQVSDRAEERQAQARSEAPPRDAAPATAGEAASGQAAAGSAPAQMQAESQSQARAAVEQALNAWAEAWSSQNVQRYLNAYSDNYRPQGDTALADWARGRRQALSGPAWIRISISDMQISLLGDDRAQASFNQHYESNTYEDRERKRMTLVREDGGWRIVRES